MRAAAPGSAAWALACRFGWLFRLTRYDDRIDASRMIDDSDPPAAVSETHCVTAQPDDRLRSPSSSIDRRDLFRGGATLEQVIAAKPTAEWDARYGDPTRIVNRGYAALTRNRR